MSVHTLDELHDAFCGPSDGDPGLAVVQQILFQTHDLPSLTHALPVLRDAWTRYLRRNPHPQLLGCILVKAAKQCQLGSQLRFGHFLADLVQAASDALPPRPSSAWPGTYRGEPGAALPQPYLEMTFQSYVVMLSSCNLGDKVLHGLYHWDKLGRPRRIHYVIRHGAACLYYDIDVLCFFPHFQWRHLPAAQDVLRFCRNFEQPLLKFQAQLDRRSAEPRPENRRRQATLKSQLA